MGIRLSRPAGPVRADLGYGVTVTIRRPSLYDLKLVRAEAEARARDRLAEAAMIANEALSGSEDGGVPRSAILTAQQKLAALAEVITLDTLVARHALSWTGVEDDAGQPARLTPEAWEAFRDAYPLLAERLGGHFVAVLAEAVAEGNV